MELAALGESETPLFNFTRFACVANRTSCGKPLLNRINKNAMNVGRLRQNRSQAFHLSSFHSKDTLMMILRLLIPFFSLAVATAQPIFQPAPALTVPLREGWTLQSSAKVTATGEAISSASFEATTWIET